jgi:hypothetical protein
MSKLLRVVVCMLSFLEASCLTANCFAWCGNCACDGQTRYMWSRTWNAQNSLSMPLTQYYVPRGTGRCDSGFKPGDMAPSVPSQYGGAPYPVAAVAGFEPLQFERLGRVPNELDLGAGLGASAGGAPAASAPRR